MEVDKYLLHTYYLILVQLLLRKYFHTSLLQQKIGLLPKFLYILNKRFFLPSPMQPTLFNVCGLYLLINFQDNIRLICKVGLRDNNKKNAFKVLTRFKLVLKSAKFACYVTCIYSENGQIIILNVFI